MTKAKTKAAVPAEIPSPTSSSTSSTKSSNVFKPEIITRNDVQSINLVGKRENNLITLSNGQLKKWPQEIIVAMVLYTLTRVEVHVGSNGEPNGREVAVYV